MTCKMFFAFGGALLMGIAGVATVIVTENTSEAIIGAGAQVTGSSSSQIRTPSSVSARATARSASMPRAITTVAVPRW